VKEHWNYWRGQTLFLKVHVSPQSRRNDIGGVSAGRLRIRLNAPPVDGKANKQLINMMAGEFATGKSRISIALGCNSRDKLIAIDRPGRLPPWLDAPQDNTLATQTALGAGAQKSRA
jgi:uncharacterized protein (TIGR00251 family)